MRHLHAQQSTRLINNWQFLKKGSWRSLGGVRSVGKGNPESVPVWKDVTLPHCVNARDAVDPDVKLLPGAGMVSHPIRYSKSL